MMVKLWKSNEISPCSENELCRPTHVSMDIQYIVLSKAQVAPFMTHKNIQKLLLFNDMLI